MEAKFNSCCFGKPKSDTDNDDMFHIYLFGYSKTKTKQGHSPVLLFEDTRMINMVKDKYILSITTIAGTKNVGFVNLTS